MEHRRLRSTPGTGPTYLERTEQTLVYAHHSSGIVEFAAIVGCTEKCHQLPFRKEFVSVFDDLMSPADQVHVVFLQEPRDDIGTECEGDASVIFAPAGDVFVGVGPEEIAQQTAIGNLHTRSVDQRRSPLETHSPESRRGKPRKRHVHL